MQLPLHLVSIPLSSLAIAVSADRIILYDLDDHTHGFISLPESAVSLALENQSKSKSSSIKKGASDEDSSDDEASSTFYIKTLHCSSIGDVVLIAVADSLKRVFVYEHRHSPQHAEDDDDAVAAKFNGRLLFSAKLPKAITKVLVTPDHHGILVGDKFGDLYSFLFTLQMVDVTELPHGTAKCPHLMLGHSSILTDIALDWSQSLIYTSQRDQKIKCTHFSYPEVIQSYLLGHGEYISSICLNERDHVMLSVGGDPYILVSDLSNDNIQYTKFYFKAFIPDISSFEGYQKHADSFNCMKILRLSHGLFGLLFENCSIIPIVRIDFMAKSIVLVRQLSFDAWVVDMASFQDPSGSSGCIAILVAGKQSVYIAKIHDDGADIAKHRSDNVEIPEPEPLAIHDEMLNPKSILDCSLQLRQQLFSWHTLRRGYNWSEKLERQASSTKYSKPTPLPT